MKCNLTAEQSPYMSANEIAKRWNCHRSSVCRVAKRAGFTSLYLGEGKSGMRRFIRREVETFESKRLFKP